MGVVLTSNNLSDRDKERAKQLAAWFKEWKRQGRKPMTQAELISKLKSTVGWDYTRHSFPALINYIRMELNICIASSNEGLYYAETIEEKQEFYKYYKSLVLERMRVLNWIEKDIERDKLSNQTYIFGDIEQKAIYDETIEEALQTKLGAIKI